MFSFTQKEDPGKRGFQRCSSKNDKQSGRNHVEQEWRNEEDHLDVLMMKEVHGNVLDALLLTRVSNCI